MANAVPAFSEDQTPRIAVAGLFIPVNALPVFLRPLSYLLPLTYGVDMLHGAMRGQNVLPLGLDLAVLALFCLALFAASAWSMHRRWIL